MAARSRSSRGAISLLAASPIPEPTTAALLLAGLAWLAGVFGRRARAGR
ncbi:MAG: PEP-CTERM sorting domain-containing protein [Sulfuritalea sp.]|nr:PEP-CTERM sorting domain-containing protein [Sulfuritalea sp.]